MIVASTESRPSTALGLLRAAHAGPAAAVTLLTALLVTAQGVEPGQACLVVLAVLAGQLSIGWGNDLVDAGRDLSTGRADKPLVTGAVSPRTVTTACSVALVCCVALSLACGWAAGAVHLVCVAMAWAYNLGLKSTIWSWLPYAVSFGGLTVFVALADSDAAPWWWVAGAALLGVGAHLLNVLPDLDDDEATGVRGLPHRLGPALIAPVASAVLLVASAVILLGGSPGAAVSLTAFTLVLLLGGVVVAGSGQAPFVAAIAIALVDTVVLVAAR